MERRTEKIGIFAPGMMTPEQYRLLLTPEVRHTVEEQIGRDPAAIALDKRIPHAALVATQVKYLARARTKLPSYYEARCILPPLAFEQASSEACAARKSCSGNTVLDLTCGLGVDALYLSKRFREVITLERDATLAAVAEENFRRLGATNIRVINSSAEAFLASTLDHFDWIYADPDRRSAGGRKLVRLEDCSPDIPKLLPELRRIAPNLCVKNSPLFDVGETFRLFGPCRTEVVSLHDECKEVVVYADGTGPLLTAVALELGEFSCTPAEARATPCDKPFDPAAYRWLLIPDVALQKARLTPTYLQGRADIWSPNGYGFAAEKSEDTLGRREPDVEGGCRKCRCSSDQFVLCPGCESCDDREERCERRSRDHEPERAAPDHDVGEQDDDGVECQSDDRDLAEGMGDKRCSRSGR